MWKQIKWIETEGRDFTAFGFFSVIKIYKRNTHTHVPTATNTFRAFVMVIWLAATSQSFKAPVSNAKTNFIACGMDE